MSTRLYAMTQLLQLGTQSVHLRVLQQGLQASVRSRAQVRASLHLRGARARNVRPPPPRLAGRHAVHVHIHAASTAEAERPPTPQHADASGRLCWTPALTEDGH